MTVRSVHVGESALLIECGDSALVRAYTEHVDALPSRSSLDEVIPASTTVTVIGDPALLRAVESSLAGFVPTARSDVGGRDVTIEVRYDGVDLPEVAKRCGLSVAEVIAAHREATYLVEFFGFGPGLAYMSGVADAISLPRMETPRTRVPPGTLAIANNQTIIYPSASSGGWHLIGTLAGLPMWDVTADPPNRVGIGDRVRFVEAAR